MTDIWQDWENRYREAGVPLDAFWKDGIIDEKAYAGARPKVLFVLKEANSDEKVDLRGFLRKRLRYPTWFVLARWAAGFLRGFPSYEEIGRSRSLLHESLTRVAVINLKKVGGGAKSDPKAINAFAYLARDLLARQIREIHPDIVVACGVFDTLMWLCDFAAAYKVQHDAPIRDRNSGFWVIPWRHPSRAEGATSYNDLRAKVLGCSELSNLLLEPGPMAQRASPRS